MIFLVGREGGGRLRSKGIHYISHFIFRSLLSFAFVAGERKITTENSFIDSKKFFISIFFAEISRVIVYFLVCFFGN